jgi:hypothetical protein
MTDTPQVLLQHHLKKLRLLRRDNQGETPRQSG